MENQTPSERRSDQERRQHNNLFYKLLFIKGNRQKVRRADDCRKIVELDRYHPTLFIAVLIVLILSLLDAALTLVLLDKGAVELNPVMRYYITLGPATFVLVKYGITALALIIIVGLSAILFKRYRILAFLIFPACATVFGSVVIWELYLLAR